ncbi:MAG: hypothetical protein GY755_06315 [Chloroflexi bacterium]|nr:hypothetical protein [Chloroflexota bacterium]
MTISNRRMRQILRIIHIVAAAFMGTYLYSPWSDIAAFKAFVLWIVFPVGFVLTGIWMWQMPKISKFLKSNVGNQANVITE